jgi:DNA-binding MarR family transcriptional regulator
MLKPDKRTRRDDKAIRPPRAQDKRQTVSVRSPRAGASAPPEELSVPPGFSDLIGYFLRIAQEASFQALRQAAGKTDLKPGWYTILSILSANPGLTPTELSRLCGRDRSTLTATLHGLDSRGLIARRRKDRDQRSYGVKLTASGEAMLRRLRVIAHAHDARLDAIVGRDKPALLALLRRLVDGLAAPAPQRPPNRRIGKRAKTR